MTASAFTDGQGQVLFRMGYPGGDNADRSEILIEGRQVDSIATVPNPSAGEALEEASTAFKKRPGPFHNR